MALDRAAVVAKADALAGKGKVDQAIDEYRRLVEEQPADVGAANALGDLYVRRGHIDKAVEQFARLADAERSQGFTSKAVALYKKALKADPAAERVLVALASIAATQELFADASLYLNRLLQAQRARGDGRAVADTLARLASLPASTIETRLAAARAVDEHLGADTSAALFASAAEALDAAARAPEALDTWLEAASRTTDPAVRRAAAEACLRAGVSERADAFLSLEVAGDHPDLLWAVAERAAASDDESTARAACRRFTAARPEASGRAEELLARWTTGQQVAAEAEDAWPAIDMDTVFSSVSADPPAVAIDAMDALSRVDVVQPDLPAANLTPESGHSFVGSEEILLEVDALVGDADADSPADAQPSAVPDVPMVAAVEPEAAEPAVLDAAGFLAQLELAAESPALRFQAAAQLGRLHMADGRWADAIRWLDAASDAPTSARDQRLSVLYDMADALERTGDVGRALTVWSDLELEAGSYRDVATRLARLGPLARHTPADR